MIKANRIKTNMWNRVVFSRGEGSWEDGEMGRRGQLYGDGQQSDAWW